MTKLNHQDLIDLGIFLGYPSLTRGLCYGFSCMWAQAVLAQDEERFFNRLELIASYNSNFWDLKADLLNAKKKASQHRQLNKKEKELLEIPAFFEGIEMYLNPYVHPDLFDKRHVNQNDINSIYPFIKSKKLEHSEVSILFNKTHIFDKTSLMAFLYDLEEKLKEENTEFPILFNNSKHSLCLKYNKIKQKWLYIDTNDFEQYPDITTYFRELETSELINNLFESLSAISAANALCNILMLACSNPISQLDSIKESLTQLDSQYPLTPELATWRDNDQLGLFFLACQLGDLSIVQKLLKYPKIEINQGTRNRETPLYAASQNNHLAVVVELLKQPQIEVNQANGNGVTPLFIACKFGHFAVVAELLKHPDILVNQENNRGETLLYVACYFGHLAVVTELLKHPGILINQAKKNGETPLHVACQFNKLRVIEELLKHPGLLINQANNEGATPLFIACSSGCLEVVAELLKHPDILINQAKKNGLTALHIACQNGYLSLVELLLKSPGIDINSQGLANHTPLLVACLSPFTSNNKNLFELLLNKGANRSLKNDRGQTAVDIAIEQNHTVALSVLLKFILTHSIHPLTLMSPLSLEKALGWAKKEQCVEVVNYLAKYKSTGSTIKFFAEPMADTDPQYEELIPFYII